MTKIDISPDAVEVLAVQHMNTANHDPRCRVELREWHSDTAATLRALAAENARLREALEKAEQQLDYGQDDAALAILRNAIAKARGA